MKIFWICSLGPYTNGWHLCVLWSYLVNDRAKTAIQTTQLGNPCCFIFLFTVSQQIKVNVHILSKGEDKMCLEIRTGYIITFWHMLNGSSTGIFKENFLFLSYLQNLESNSCKFKFTACISIPVELTQLLD